MNTQTDSLLPTFEPSEQDLVNRALAQPLEKKIARAIALLQHWEPEALKLDPRGYWVADSFGKDSDCIVELAKMAGVAHHCEHNLTTIDPPELIWYGKRTRPGTHINRPKVPLLNYMVDHGKGPPTRLARWCCREYKEGGGNGSAKIIGVRIEESSRRASMWKEYVRNRRAAGFFLCAIAYWTEADVWAFHELRGIPHCSLYDEKDSETGERMFHRLGCVGCPLATANGQTKEFGRWPSYERMWFNAVKKLYPCQRRMDGGKRWYQDFGSAQGLWDWWRSGVGQGDGPACQGAELFSMHELGDENANDE